MLPSETMIWQPEFTDKTLSRKPGAVQFAISLKPVPFFHSSKTEAFSSAVNVRLIQKTSATPCFHITVALTN
ncbi:hypothetical protein DM408_23440 [Escherichia coli]|nr:hypothetical protein [Escherichia coli]